MARLTKNMNIDVCNEGARFTVKISMTFLVNPNRMMHCHKTSYKIHSFGRYRKGRRLDELRISIVSGHVVFMTLNALSKTVSSNLFLTERKMFGDRFEIKILL